MYILNNCRMRLLKWVFVYLSLFFYKTPEVFIPRIFFPAADASSAVSCDASPLEAVTVENVEAV